MNNMDFLKASYRKMLKIRLVEQKILFLYSQNKISGTTHTYIGQEAIAVAAMNHICEGDFVFSNHRCHGHYIAYGGHINKLFAEIMSKETGLCGGKGGSQHLHYRKFYSNGIQGGIVPNALGTAWAEKIRGTNNIAMVFLGDGTLGQGVVYEAFNMASLYNVPILFVVENNKYAMSTKCEDAISGSIIARAEAFNIKSNEVSSNDIEVLDDYFKKAIGYTRLQSKPYCLVINTYRLGAHSKGDDTRDPLEIQYYQQFDPLRITESKLDPDFCQECKESLTSEIDKAVNEIETHDSIIIDCEEKDHKKESFPVFNDQEIRVVEAINSTLESLMQENNNILLLGEDIRDNYGGAFKVTKTLSKKFNARVINTPISEAGIIGAGVGLALNGMLPFVEIMFGDFLTLGFDQILNHATKYAWLYGQGVSVPLVIRTPMGGRRGYGATHSQSLEKFLIGIPLLKVLAISPVHNVAYLYKYAVSELSSPLIIIENKKMYAEKLKKYNQGKIDNFFAEYEFNNEFPTIYLSLDNKQNPDVTLICYGGMVDEVMRASQDLLIDEEIQVDIIVLSQLSPIPIEDLLSLTKGSAIIGTVEEGTLQSGIGAEIIACLTERQSMKRYFRIAARDLPIPNGIILESQVIPNATNIINRVKENYYERNN